MKKQSWLGALENVSLLGLGVGSIATVVFKEILYTTTPLSMLVVLGLLDRRRFEDNSRRRDVSLGEMNQKLSSRLETVIQHVANLPSVETVQQLRQGLIMKDREVAKRLYSEITALQQELLQRLNSLEQHGVASTRQDLDQLGTQHYQLAGAVTQISHDMRLLEAQISDEMRLLEALAQSSNSQSAIAKLQATIADLQANLDALAAQTEPNFASLQEQISRLDRQFAKLPPPVDLTALKQEVSELVRMITELVPRRDLLALINEVRDLHQQQERLKQSVEAIEMATVGATQRQASQTAAVALPFDDPLLQTVDPASFQEFEFQKFDREVTGEPQGEADSAELDTIQAGAVNYLRRLRAQLATVQAYTENLAAQHRHLQVQLDQLPKHPEVAGLQEQLQELARRIPAAETTLEDFRGRIQDVIQQELSFINDQLQTVPPSYEFVFDLNSPSSPRATAANLVASTLTGSRTILEEALTSTQNRLILILPWSDRCDLDAALLEKLEAFLSQGKQLNIGWCHLADRAEERLIKKLKRGWMSDAAQIDPLQHTLHQLLHLKRVHPKAFHFKVLGTSENFLVSDQSFAVLGIAEPLKTSTAFSELQLKLKTREPEVIQRLTNCFDQADLEQDDLVAYWNRGVTRHDLGDKTGAIADYSQILSFNPDDAIAYNYRGIAHYDAGNSEAAIADLSASIQFNPQQAAAYCNRGFIHLEQGNPTSAIADYNQALQNRPDWAIVYFYRGMAWQKLENYQNAIADYGEAIYLAPDSAAARYYRGLAWQKLRNYQGAIGDLEVAATLFISRGSKNNAVKAHRNLVKLRQMLAQIQDSAVAETDEQPKKPDRRLISPDFEAIANLFGNAKSGSDLKGESGGGSIAGNSLASDAEQLIDAETLN